MKIDAAIQFETAENANTFKDFYSESPRNLARKLLVAPHKFNDSTKQYCMDMEKHYHNFELCSASLETIKKILSCLYTSRAPSSDRIFSKFLKDGAEVSGLPLYNLVNLPIK